jgi:hypothetical protein
VVVKRKMKEIGLMGFIIHKRKRTMKPLIIDSSGTWMAEWERWRGQSNQCTI